MRRRCFFLLIGCALMFSQNAAAGEIVKTKHYDLKVELVADGFKYPWSLAWLPDGRMLVTEKPGQLRIVSKNGAIGEPVGGVPKVVDSGQGGLLDVLVDPDFATNNTIFLSYSEPGQGGSSTAVARGVLDNNALRDVEVIFRQQPKIRSGYHFGSRLVMGRDGHLFITLGERGERKLAQDTSVHRGQVVRLSKDGKVPNDNPFVGKDGYRPEIWSYGHRNPQGAALHPQTGALWIVEHGARGGDELNISKAGRNYGWPVISYGRHYSGFTIGEGTKKAGMEQPIHYWDPSIAPSGLLFYTGDKFPKWKGNLFAGALKYRLLARLELAGKKLVKEERILKDHAGRIRDVRQGPDGYIYVVTDADPGKVLRLMPR